MGMSFLLFFLTLLLSCPFSSFSSSDSINQASYLSVERPNQDVLISANSIFTAGFRPIGDNAYCFAIWFSPQHDKNKTLVWMANRDQPVNGRRSKLSLLKSGNLVLTDAGQLNIWTTNTKSNTSMRLKLRNDGNLVLHTLDGTIHWQSFESPTNTLLPQQPLTQNIKLVSSRSRTNHSSGFYKLYFDNDNVLRLVFQGPEISSVYWPNPWETNWAVGRFTYNNSRTAVLDLFGHFLSSDKFRFSSTDFGLGPQRRLTIDVDGNIRVYSLDKKKRSWKVSWQAFDQPCRIHGICGPNSICTYTHDSGRRCSCIHGYKLKNQTDWSYGCEPNFKFDCDESKVGFIQLPHVEFYGYDSGYYENYNLERCKEECLKFGDCKGFQFIYDTSKDFYLCYTKGLLFNGHRSLGFGHPMYIKLPKTLVQSHQNLHEFNLNCSSHVSTQLSRSYNKKHKNGSLRFIIWFACACGGIEILAIICFLYFIRQPRDENLHAGYLHVATGFKRFTYDELKKASRNFSEEIGRGGSGVVYKAILSDNRVAAIKRLNEANRGEAEFLAEVSTIGRLNHRNLIETWGYCAEGKHRLLVYEYMDNGSLAKNLYYNELQWETRFEIAVGTAKGLAYLHEECLEWVLHCDVKPQNILLDVSCLPKVADFGLSKLLSRGSNDSKNSGFSKIRGTRGYMAPEWIFNLPITSKVDVYSYGIVLLEMITRRSPTGVHASTETGEMEQRRLVSWVREKMHEADGRGSWIEEIVDPAMYDAFHMRRMEILVRVAMKCVEEDRDARPTMSQVVDTLLCQKNYD